MGERVATQTYQGSRILLVEDSDDLRPLMTLILEAEGYEVDTARTAEEGLRLLDARPYDLVLSDYALPGRTGTWMLREAVARLKADLDSQWIVWVEGRYLPQEIERTEKAKEIELVR